jgi:H+/Cl- antiporter ClcA
MVTISKQVTGSGPDPAKNSWLLLGMVTVLTGVAAGFSGMLLALLLHLIQHVAYGYSLGAVVSHETFLEGVSAASPLRRFLVLSVCGLVAGIGWWGIYRFGRPLVSISSTLSNAAARMPPLTTITHDLLQIVTVALGSPLGRELAPREIGALLASSLCRRAGITAEASRIMIACGAGAGLAAVYNVPLAGALFALEGLLGTFSLSALIPAITTSAIAANVAWIGLGNETPYPIPHLVISPSLVVWSILAGPVFGFPAYWFGRAVQIAHKHAPKDWRLPIWCVVVFLTVGVIAIRFPQILGNGRGLAQLGFDGDLSIPLAAILLLLRTSVAVGCLRAGAEGGVMTPSVAIGGVLAAVIGQAWSSAWPGSPAGAFAVVGATAFLGSSLKMPLTAIVLMMEFTRVEHDFLFPTLFAVAGSVSVCRLCDLRFARADHAESKFS